MQEILPQILPLTDSERDIEQAQEWDRKIRAFFDERGLRTLSQQTNRFTDIRNAIKIIDPQHSALQYIGLSTDEHIEVNAKASSRTDNRITKLIEDPLAVTERASSLLSSPQWASVAAGLAVVTGRRVCEVLQTAHFELVSTYVVLFSGAAKRRGETIPLVFEIPTLVKAQGVIDAIAYLRTHLNTEGLDNRQINAQYESKVAQECDRAFRDLVPARDGKTNLYTHLFRSVYATIATHWYCPTHVSDLEFRAYIQGHFQIIDEPKQQRRLSLASSKHYWDYKISDGHGNVDGRLGIKLHEPDVEVVDYFVPQEKQPPMAENYGDLVKVTVWERDRQSLAQIQDRFNLDNRATANNYVLKLAHSLIDAADKLNLTPEVLISRLDELKSNDLMPTDTTKSDPKKEALKSEQLSISSEENHPSAQPEDELLPQALTDPSSILINNMNTQQQAFNNLTTAIYDLIEVLKGDRIQPSDRDVDAQEPQPSENLPQRATVEVEKPVSSLEQYSLDIRERVSRYIDAIMAFNDTPHRSHQSKWAITVAILRKLADCGSSPVYAVYNARKDEIEAHNQKHQFDFLHNRKGKNSPNIESVIHIESE